MQWNWENWRVGASKPLTANPRSSRRRRFRHHRADDHLIPFFQFTVHESRNFRIRMVRDSERDLHRSMLLSAWNFQTTALSDRGARGFCAAPLEGPVRSAATASSLAVFLSPAGSIPYCLYSARTSSGDIGGL